MTFRRSFLRPFAAVSSCAALAGCAPGPDGASTGTSTSAVTEKCGESANGPVQGVDVSDYQGNFDWAAAHVAFGYAQISDGLGYSDWSFEGNWSRMKSAGVLRGAYQFFEPNEDEVAQANMMVAKVGKLGEGDLPSMIDVEVTRGESPSTIGAKVRTWLEVVEKGTGKRPIIYTGSYFWEDSVGTNLGAYPIWIAAYGSSCPSLPADGWSNWAFWQYSDGGGALDHDVYNGSLAQLRALAGSGASSPVETVHVGASVVANRDGRLEAFGRGNDDALWHVWQEKAGGAWSSWSRLGGNLGGDPVAIQNEDGRLEVFAVTSSGTVDHIWQKTTGGSWSDWASLGGKVVSRVGAGSNRDGRIEVFALGTDDAVWHAWQTTPNGSWSHWASLGGKLKGDPSVAANADGRLEVFARSSSGESWHVWQTTPGGSWSDGANLGGSLTSDPAVSKNQDGRLEVFGLASDGSLRHSWQLKPNGSWSDWANLGGDLTLTPAVAENHDGRLEVFGLAPNKSIWHVWQDEANGSWGSWSRLGSWDGTTAPVPAMNLDGRLEVFVVGTDQHLDHTWQEKPGGGWAAWTRLGDEKL